VKFGFLALKGKFELKVLRSMFESNREEITGNWKKLHNEKLNNLYSF
jgi:hypothetical protein